LGLSGSPARAGRCWATPIPSILDPRQTGLAAILYNVTDDEPARVSVWLPYLAEAVDAKPPMHVAVWLARIMAGSVAVRWMTAGRGSSNAKAKRELDRRPAWASWREGVPERAGSPVRTRAATSAGEPVIASRTRSV
jgi:hypothetical protein